MPETRVYLPAVRLCVSAFGVFGDPAANSFSIG